MTLEEILDGESKNLKFKVQRPKNSTKYMKSVVAFANGGCVRIVKEQNSLHTRWASEQRSDHAERITKERRVGDSWMS